MASVNEFVLQRAYLNKCFFSLFFFFTKNPNLFFFFFFLGGGGGGGVSFLQRIQIFSGWGGGVLELFFYKES